MRVQRREQWEWKRLGLASVLKLLRAPWGKRGPREFVPTRPIRHRMASVVFTPKDHGGTP